MASLIFAQAKSIRKKAKNAQSKYINGDPEFAANVYDSVVNAERGEFREILKIAKLLHEDYEEITGRTTTNWYFITIRPKPEIKFEQFLTYIEKFIKRSCIIDYTLSLEQKSTTGDGTGFHCHLICNTKHRSKGECLRDTLSTFNKICEPQCIQIDITRDPQKIINAYLIAYESKDNHKINTKEGDAIWRAKYNILPLYSKTENPFLALSIKSIETVPKSIQPFIVNLN